MLIGDADDDTDVDDLTRSAKQTTTNSRFRKRQKVEYRLGEYNHARNRAYGVDLDRGDS